MSRYITKFPKNGLYLITIDNNYLVMWGGHVYPDDRFRTSPGTNWEVNWKIDTNGFVYNKKWNKYISMI